MLTTMRKTIFPALLLVVSFFLASTVQAQSNLFDKYQHQGQIIDIDKVKRLLTVQTTTTSSKGSKHFLTINTKAYNLEVGAKLSNIPKTMRYTGLKSLREGTLVYFNIKSGTEKLSNPVITEMWLEFQ